MTRSGVVQSVHAFGEDSELAWLFTGFMVVIATFSFGLVIYRLPLLRARNELDSWMSREAAFLVNNWILLFSAFFILFATMFPTLSEAVTGKRLTVAQPFFNKWMVPIGLILLFLTGVGPLLAWRKSTLSNLRDSFLWPVARGVVTAGASSPRSASGSGRRACASRCARSSPARSCRSSGAARNVRRRATGTDVFTALVGLVGRNKRRYGGYIVHLGIVLIFLGFAGNGYKRDQQMLLKPGETGHHRRLHRAQRRHQGDRRRPEADDDGLRRRLQGRQADRHDVSGQVVVPQARGRAAADRGRDPPRARPKTSTSSCRPSISGRRR